MEDIARGVRSFTIGTTVSRLLGLGREMVFAHLFGSSRSTDAFNAAFRIPNLLRDLFAETSLSAAFVPVLTEQKGKGKQQQNLLASNIINTLLLVVGLITILGMIFSRPVASLVAMGFSQIPEKLSLTASLTFITFPFLMFVSLAAWAMSYHNTEGSFFIPSVAPAFFNVFSIAVPLAMFGYYTARGGDPIFGAAIGVTVGGLMQFLIQVPGVFRRGYRYRFYLNWHDPQFRKVMALFIPVAIGLAGSRINVFVNTILVSYLAERSMTWLNYAYRIMHLPLGLFGMAVGTVALPRFSRLVLDDKPEELKISLMDSLKMVFFLTVPSSILIAFFSYPLTRLIYQRGQFLAADTAAVSQALILYVPGIPFISALRNVASVFYAHKDARAPMYASFASIALNIVMNLALMKPIGFLAFPLSASVASVVNIYLLMRWLPRKIGEVNFSPVYGYFLKLALVSAAAGLAGYYGFKLLTPAFGATFLPVLGLTLFCGTASLLIFYFGCRLLRIKEVDSYLRRFLRK
ncbi:MAG: murein biosynthesis integral membrane protein MurJ [Candidatus Aminicenantes bacterium]|nr:murein biosynthesis integral membrane protein MurJ [Candidatus Aminicenantes bacterium]